MQIDIEEFLTCVQNQFQEDGSKVEIEPVGFQSNLYLKTILSSRTIWPFVSKEKSKCSSVNLPL